MVKSRYLSPGYWRRPELTKAKFLPDVNNNSMRIYRTGDLGRMSPDSCLVYIGRKDFQVRVRGYGVETTEVEMALAEHKAIRDVAVVGFESAATETRLVCFYVPACKPGPSVSELRGHLVKVLPDYMIPSAFVSVDSLPLTPNGKIDRKSLPFFSNLRPRLDTPFAAATSAIEADLINSWVDALGIEQVGIHDDFFELGGNSLAATRVISRVIEKFKAELPLKTLFEFPTVAQMAKVIQQDRIRVGRAETLENILTELEAIKLRQSGERNVLQKTIPRQEMRDSAPLSFAQQRLWFLNQLEPESAGYNEAMAR